MMADPSIPIPASRPSARLIQLDLLRGIAVVMILFNHQPATPESYGGALKYALLPVLKGLWTGVDLFFVLSGYLIGGLLIAELRKTGRIDLKRFWIRRGFKIWPSYYLYIAVLAILTSLFYVDHAIKGSQAQGLLINAVKLVYIQNYFPMERRPWVTVPLGNHTWTLAVEEHFYFLLPVVLVLASRRWRVVLPTVAFLLLAGCLALRLRSFGQPMNWIWDYEVTHKRIDALFFGVFLAYLFSERPALMQRLKRHRGVLGLAGLALIAPMFLIDLATSFVKTIGYTCLSLGYGCLLLSLVLTEPGSGVSGRIMTSRPAKGLAWIGFWSYSIYIWHFDLFRLASWMAMRWPGPLDAWPSGSWVHLAPWQDAYLVSYLVISIGLGVGLGHLIERPMLALRDRLYPSRTGSAIAPAPSPEPSGEVTAS